MRLQLPTNGHGPDRGLIQVVPLGDECHVVQADPSNPPAPADLPAMLASVLAKWIEANGAKVRQVVPIVREGNTSMLMVFHEPLG